MTFRKATINDISEIVEMIADHMLGKREKTSKALYLKNTYMLLKNKR
ncbi:hypothetical protein MWU58_10290 [Flavobacteriaceae bacterium S0825]|nr:hypothetical protein [Gaetbulibacter sp. S0825]MCK0109684.1 hypothetical protein [Flavobacteriaceae bacterium S0825]